MVESFVVSFVVGVEFVDSRPKCVFGFALAGGAAILLILNKPQVHDLRHALRRLASEPHFAAVDPNRLEERRVEIYRAREGLHGREPDRFVELSSMKVTVIPEGAVVDIADTFGHCMKLTLDLAAIVELLDASGDSLPLMEGKHLGSNLAH